MLELQIGALGGLKSDGAAFLPVLRASGDAARLGLASGDGACFAPGEYRFEARARALDGNLAFRLVIRFLGGGEQIVDLAETAPGVWRCVLVLEGTAEAFALAVVGAARFIFAGARIEADETDAAPAPTLRAGFIVLGRALFRKLPHWARRALLASGRRAKWLARVRGSDAGKETPGAAAAGRLLGAADGVDAYQADFENRFAAARGLAHPSYSDEAPPPKRPAGAAKLIAFHLPQFHPIPENDAWWGKGFTEWTNVAKAAPQFVGHDQPRLPGELGFYDLRTPGLLAQQAALARAYGVSAFCFHYYWFAGKRLLEAPLDAFVQDSSIDIEFCLCWANENWTRRWDGDEAQILIAQRHTREDHERVFADMARYLEDPRYLRIDGKPLLLVYRPDIIAGAREMTALWRDLAVQRGWPGIFLAATNAFRFDEPERLGFDALVEFPPHGFVAESIADKLSWLNPSHTRAVFDYQQVAGAAAARAGRGAGAVFPGIMPGWDNEARRPGAGTIYHGATPDAYGAWLRAAVARAARTLPADRRLVFINAWNEWAEGAYLEPDRRFGRAFLAETARALSGA